MRPAAQVAIGGEATGKSSGKQDTTIPGNATQSSDGAEADDATATAATVVIEDSAESSAKVTTVQFSPPAGPNLDAASLAVVSPQITKLVRQVTQGSAVVGACMMWLARQTDDKLKTDQAQKLMDYCQWRRLALDRLATPQGACLAWLASGEGTEDKVRGSLCADVLRTSGTFAQAGATTDLRVAAK
jgi:hypothetical protein